MYLKFYFDSHSNTKSQFMKSMYIHFKRDRSKVRLSELVDKDTSILQFIDKRLTFLGISNIKNTSFHKEH
ncbi:hypothetical protein BpHYR1_049015 [Brachionus plicatilis]|uniref:Uncharacterized protein n=1 Tax=Brachionus plicatilis TaxID=10195 RepID=A0A3M7RHT5_BRAPC|nr:hypothetical protein BpHYR1_049015 [Brachionus plicatilis]